MIGAVVDAASGALGLTGDHAVHLGEAAAAVGRAIHERGFDDPEAAAVDVEVLASGHRVVVHVDDLCLPFAYEEEAELDGAVLARALERGWIDEVHHRWRGRDGNRTTLVRHLDPGPDLRNAPPEAPGADPDAADDLATTSRLATPADAEAICRLAWRTYGPTYQHDEYYQPDRLARMLADGTQVSFVTVLDSGELVGHSAVVIDEPGAVVVEGGRAMVDPRFRGHHLMTAPRQLEQRWFAEHGVLALAGAAVTAHTRSQHDGPVLSVMLGFLPPVRFEGIEETDTSLREAVVGGLVPMAEIPPQEVHLPRRDAAMLEHLYGVTGLGRRTTAGSDAGPALEGSAVDVKVHADLGHAVLVVRAVGSDLRDALRQRLVTLSRGGIEVTYVDLALDDPAVSWAADVTAGVGCILAGLQPLERRGVDVVRYQHLGTTRVDPAAIHLRSPDARALLDYVLAQREEE
jgi:serine/threonine-protein kinase RsbW